MNITKVRLSFLWPVLLMAVTARAGELRVHFTDSAGSPLPHGVVEITSPDVPVPADWDFTAVMDQEDKEFVPHVLPVVAGTEVSFPNSDEILHHVYSFSRAKTFELPLYTGDNADPVLFDTPGVVEVGCNIHDWMLAYIYVGETHLLAKSRAEGTAVMSGLDPGEYTFKIWHPRARDAALAERHMVRVPADGAGEVEISLELTADRRIRRAPTPTGGGYLGP